MARARPAYGRVVVAHNRHTLPTSLRGAVWIADLAQRFVDETVMCSPPPAVQRVPVPAMARFAR